MAAHFRLDREAAEQGAEQDRQEGAHLDETVAAKKLVAFEMLRQDRIFDWAEKGRLDASQEDRQELQPHLVGEQADGGERDDYDLDELDAARQHGLVEFI